MDPGPDGDGIKKKKEKAPQEPGEPRRSFGGRSKPQNTPYSTRSHFALEAYNEHPDLIPYYMAYSIF